MKSLIRSRAVLAVGGFSVWCLGACTVDMKGLGAENPDASGVGTGGGQGDTGGESGATGGAPGSGGGVIGSGGAAESGGRTGNGGRASGGRQGTGGQGTGGQATGGAGGRGCGPNTCPNGCCDGNTCVTNRNDQTCGNGGVACAPCAACFRCSSGGACDLDESSLWTVTCVSATVATTQPGGQTWDPGPAAGLVSAPDPFCEFQINEIGQRDTTVVVDSFSPEWDQSISPNNPRTTANYLLSNAGAWSVLVGDFDAPAMDNQEICQVFPTLTAANFTAGTVRFANNRSCTSLTIRLDCAE